jgi:hypothetical protein
MPNGNVVIHSPKSLIESRIAEGLDDLRKRRVHGPFRSMPALLRSLLQTKKNKTTPSI